MAPGSIKHNQKFIRTTDADHKAAMQAFLQKVYDNGDIYFGEHGGHCTGCERFYTEGTGKRPVPAAPDQAGLHSGEELLLPHVKYLPWLAGHIRENPDFIRPERYRNEVLSMIESGALEDLCISRPKTRLEWDIELPPFDKDYVCYVWFDALLNYISALGWPDGDKSMPRTGPASTSSPRIWQAARRVLAHHAEIRRVPLYKHLNVHGYWLIKDTKIVARQRGRAHQNGELTGWMRSGISCCAMQFG